MALIQNGYQVSGSGDSVANAAISSANSTNQALESMRSFFGQVGKVASVEHEKTIKTRSNLAIEQAVQDAAINVTPDMLQADILENGDENVYNKAYNQAANTIVASNVSTLARSRMAEMANEFGTDPDGFGGAIEGMFENISKEFNLNTQSQAYLATELRSEQQRYVPKIAAAAYEKQKQAEFASQKTELATITNIALNNVRQGDASAFDEDYKTVESRLNLMVHRGQITSVDKEDALQGFKQEATSQKFVGSIERDLKRGMVATAINSRNAWEKQLRDSGVMTPDEVDKELLRVDSLIKSKQVAVAKVAKTQKAVSQSDQVLTYKLLNNIPLDYKNSGDKKAVNKIFDSNTSEFDEEGNLVSMWQFDDPEQRNVGVNFAMQTGVVPEKLKSAVRTSLYSTDPDIAQNGISTLLTLETKSPQLLEQFSDQDVAFATNVNSLISSGVDAQTALQQTKDLYKQDFKVRQQAAIAAIGNNEDFTDQVKKGVNAVVDSFDDSFFSDPAIKDDSAALMRHDYQTIFKNNLAFTSNTADAHKLTQQQITRKWSATEINGKVEIMAYPPELMIKNVSPQQIKVDAETTKHIVALEVAGGDVAQYKLHTNNVKRLDELDQLIRLGGDSVTVKKYEAERTKLAKKVNKYTDNTDLADIQVKFMPTTTTATAKQPVYGIYVKDESGMWKTKTDEHGRNQYWTALPQDGSTELVERKQVVQQQEIEKVQKNRIKREEARELTSHTNLPRYLTGK